MKKKKKKLPTTVDLVRSRRSPVALAALLRTGAGPHSDKRQRPRRRDWSSEA